MGKTKRNAGFKFLMQSRGPEVDELLKDPAAFVLLTQIARRAKRTNDFTLHDLKIGEALIGDYDSIGLTEQRYRSAKKRLERYGLATFKPTNKGTIAKLTNSLIYDVNLDHSNDQTNNQKADKQRSNNDQGNRQATTNNNVNNDNNAKNEKNVREENPPTLEQCIQFFMANNGFREWAERFYNHYQAAEWKTESGFNVAKGWKGKALKWIQQDRQKENLDIPLQMRENLRSIDAESSEHYDDY